MKNSFLLLTLLLSLSTTSCSGGESGKDAPVSPAEQIQISVSPENLTPDFNSQTLELKVTVNADWSIRTDASWISFRPSGGVKNEPTTVKVNIDANKEFDSRNAEINIISGNKVIKSINITQGYVTSATSSVSSMIIDGEGKSQTFTITSNTQWTIDADSDWISVNPNNGSKGETKVSVSCNENAGDESRTGKLSIIFDGGKTEIKVTQLNYKVNTPSGYTLVWSDEFNEDGRPGPDWVHENWNAGYVNNELQTYTSKAVDGKYTTEVKEGFLHINCFKGSDGKIYSGRINAKPNTGWTYGYVEARINLPSGKGTWPAFWMMPSNVDWNSNPWPLCGEIDIMEEVGVDANEVSSSLHTGKYNHTKGTQKTHSMHLQGAEGEFHVYALEWTAEGITTYVDGKVQLKVSKAEMGNDHESWPFHYAFYPILNLAWGGDWGGYAGVNEAALPVTMLVDYVRIFQKNN